MTNSRMKLTQKSMGKIIVMTTMAKFLVGHEIWQFVTICHSFAFQNGFLAEMTPVTMFNEKMSHTKVVTS